MLALVATPEVDGEVVPLPSWQYLVGADHSLRKQAETGACPPGEAAGHDDSWGVGWFDAAGEVSLVRQTGSAIGSAYFVFASETAARGGAGSGPGRVILGHLRKASAGAVNSENAHPVRVDYIGSGRTRPYDTLLVAHNGTLYAPLLDTLRADLDRGNREEMTADSDTVVLAGWLALRVGQSGADDLFGAVSEALTELFTRSRDLATDGDLTKIYSGVNLLIGHGDGLFVLRQFSKTPDYYTLFVRPIEAAEGVAAG